VIPVAELTVSFDHPTFTVGLRKPLAADHTERAQEQQRGC
jgi:hypothetical protein